MKTQCENAPRGRRQARPKYRRRQAYSCVANACKFACRSRPLA